MPPELSPLSVLTQAAPREKAKAARLFRQSVLEGHDIICSPLPDHPARPKKPALVSPRDLRRRGLGSPEGRAALLHAIAHIELNAIDLAADMIARFVDALDIASDRSAFIDDWSSVCDDEARHFIMIDDRLRELGHRYGDFPAHNGLWDAAMQTNGDIAARLAVAPLVLEARGLDVTPGMIEKLTQAGDHESSDLLKVIYSEEVGHVRIGLKWLKHVAKFRQIDSQTLFRGMVREHFKGVIKPPFNHGAREKAGLTLKYYENLS